MNMKAEAKTRSRFGAHFRRAVAVAGGGILAAPSGLRDLKCGERTPL